MDSWSAATFKGASGSCFSKQISFFLEWDNTPPRWYNESMHHTHQAPGSLLQLKQGMLGSGSNTREDIWWVYTQRPSGETQWTGGEFFKFMHILLSSNIKCFFHCYKCMLWSPTFQKSNYKGKALGCSELLGHLYIC